MTPDFTRRSLLAAALTIAASPAALAQIPVASLDQLAAQARTKGPVIWYESSPTDQADKIAAAFAKRFPGYSCSTRVTRAGRALAPGSSRRCRVMPEPLTC